MAEKMHVKIMLPERVLYEGDADSTRFTAFDGEMTLFPKHCPYIQKLADKGKITVRDADKGNQTFEFRGGYAEYNLKKELSVCILEMEADNEES